MLLNQIRSWKIIITATITNVSGGKSEKALLYHYLITDSPHQKIQSIDQNPRGKLKQDKEQNTFSILKVPELLPQESFVIKTSIKLETRTIDFPFNKSKIEEIPKKLIQSNCKIDKFWEFDDDRVKMIANNLLQKSNGFVYDFLFLVFRFTWQKIKIRAALNERLGVLKVLETYEGDCDEFSDLFISLARAVKIPARRVVGLSIHEHDNKIDHQNHAWAEAYIPNVGWVTFDPALRKFATITKYHISRCRMGTVSHRNMMTLQYKVRKYEHIWNLNEDIVIERLEM